LLFDNHYITIKKNAKSEFKDRGSKFYGFALKTNSKAEFESWLLKTKAKFPDATHHCYAYSLHPDKSEQYDSDDGEPSNSAGKPILRAIQSIEATQVAVIVVRYYGGVNLGIPGLINAYGTAAKLALENAMPFQKDIEEIYEASSLFGHEEQWYNLVNNSLVHILEQKVLETGYWAKISVKKNKSTDFTQLQKELYHLKISFKHFI
jgi:uncharacterized YigZ family protein